MISNWEDSLMGGSLVLSVIVGMAMHNISAPEITATAIASEKPAIVAAEPAAPALVFTVTGKRMPAECKGTPVDAAVEARCEALRDQTTVEVAPGR